MTATRQWPALVAGLVALLVGAATWFVIAGRVSSTALDSISLKDLDGQLAYAWSPGTGKVRVFVFTRTDCPIANRYAPELKAIEKRFRGRGVEFVLVFVDPREPAETIREHLREYQLPFPALVDPEHKLVAYLNATVTPEAAVLAGDGRLAYLGRIDDRYTDIGRPRADATSHDLADAIQATLDGRSVVPSRKKAVGCLIVDLRK
ncbi:MAG: redoxin domain-containing protein [Gemmataceae bacterium]|nr:redoxin domain-containing protein [Gemmataceae bacterium]